MKERRKQVGKRNEVWVGTVVESLVSVSYEDGARNDQS